jgi:RNA methyltransferase, TrmH family
LITSLQNERIKEVVRLRDRQARDRTGLFLLEGQREILRAIEAGVEIETLYWAPDICGEHSLTQTLPSEACALSVFKKISYRESPDGLLAVARQRSHRLEGIVLSEQPLLLLVEAVEKPGNLGAMLRSCDGVGVDGLIVCDPVIDLYNPNVVRASMSALFSVPVAIATVQESIAWLQSNGISIIIASPDAAGSYWESDLRRPVAIGVGAEHAGLSHQLCQVASQSVSIPMRGSADSLNVATAATLLLYEALRQRI